MDFTLSTEQEILRESVRSFAENEIRPVARELDSKEEFSYETMQKMAELGLFGIVVSEAYGGQGMDYLSYRDNLRHPGPFRTPDQMPVKSKKPCVDDQVTHDTGHITQRNDRCPFQMPAKCIGPPGRTHQGNTGGRADGQHTAPGTGSEGNQ